MSGLTAEEIQRIPIEIHCSRLIDWLLDRRHFTIQQQQALVKIRSEITSNLTVNGKSNPWTDYSYCSSCDSIPSSLLRRLDKLRLLDYCSYLQSGETVELSSLRRQVSRISSQIQECYSRATEAEKRASEQRLLHEIKRKKLGLDGKETSSLREELINTSGSLRSQLNEIATDCAVLLPLISYFKTNYEINVLSHEKDKPLSLLEFVTENGNVSAHQYLTGETPPDATQEDDLVKVENEAVENEDIDWDIVDIENKEEESIDWGIETLDVSSENLSLEKSSVSVLECNETRQTLLNDLKELKCFALMRVYQLQGEIIDNINLTDIETGVDLITSILDRLNNEKMCHWLQLNSSPAYVERLVIDINAPLVQAERLKTSSQKARERASNLSIELNALKDKIDKWTEQCSFWREYVETEISKLYKNRPVYIING